MLWGFAARNPRFNQAARRIPHLAVHPLRLVCTLIRSWANFSGGPVGLVRDGARVGTGAVGAGLLARRLARLLKRLARLYSRWPAGIGQTNERSSRGHHAAHERNSASSAMVVQRALLHAVAEHHADAIFMTNPAGRVTYANREAERMFGWRQDELLGRTLDTVAGGQGSNSNSGTAWGSKLSGSIASQTSCQAEAIVVRRDGHKLTVACSFTPVVVDDKVTAAVLTVREITAYTRIDTAQRENEARLRDLPSAPAPANTLVLDADGTIRVWSQGCERLYGWSGAEAIGQTAATLLQTHFPVPAEKIDAVLLRDGQWLGDLIQTRRNGSRITVTVRTILRRGPNGEPTAIMQSVLDVTAIGQVTERGRAQVAPQRSDRDLEPQVAQELIDREAVQARAAHAERMQALGQLAGGIAHDFNNILQVVAGSAALIEQCLGDGPAMNRIVRRIIDSTDRGAAIARRMLIFARRGKLEAEAIEPAALLEGLREICQYTLGEGIAIRVEVSAALPCLFADKGQLETALVNLAINARDAMSSSGILILSAEAVSVVSEVNHPAALAPGAYIRLAVSDNGIGMNDAVLARVGEPFFTTKAAGEGTGLGLSMVKGFAEQSGGGFSVSSSPDTGTVVSLWLPQAEDAVAKQPAEPVTRGSRPGCASCVLLVDDDKQVRETLAAQLEAEGYVVAAASAGEHALSLLREAAPIDILVTDLAMPGMNGLTLIQQARGLRSRLPAILLTGYVEDGAPLAFGGAVSGCYAVLRKPVSGSQLAARIAVALEPAAYAV